MHFEVKKIQELSSVRLFRLLQLRQEVFIVEQNCPYLDADHKDPLAFHVLGYFDDDIHACARILSPGISYEEFAIGRIITSMKIRRMGFGIELMNFCHQWISEEFGPQAIRISAQCYLEKFYKNLGYEPTGKEYLEDGIPHMEMLRAI